MAQALSQDSLVEYGSRRVIITITAIICTLLEIIDTTIVNVALNDMRGNLGATLTEVAWVITAYAIGNVIIIPMTSWLSTQFGRRNYFAASIMIFTLCSFLCGNANGIWELVAIPVSAGDGGRRTAGHFTNHHYRSLSPGKKKYGAGDLRTGCDRGPDIGPAIRGIYR